MAIFQSSRSLPPDHQAGIVLCKGHLYRPNVVRIAHEHSRRNASGGDHRHGVYHLVYAHAGAGECRIEGGVGRIPAGAMLCISPGQSHMVGMDAPGCRYGALTFEFLSLEDDRHLDATVPELLGLLRGETLEPPETYPLLHLKKAARGLHELAGDVYSAALADSAEAAAALQRFLLRLAASSFATVRGEEGLADPAMELVRDMLAREFARPLTLGGIAKSFHLSRRSLNRRFHAAFGLSPIAYRLHRRMEAARVMLRASDLLVKEIALEVGFSDVYQFSRAFKKAAGLPPSALRPK